MNTSLSEKKVVIDLATHHLEKQATNFVEQFDKINPVFNSRQQALKIFKQLGVPTTRHEDWKYTDLQPLVTQKPSLPPLHEPVAIQPDQKLRIESYINNIILKNNTDTDVTNVLVIIDGIYNSDLSIRSKNSNKNCENYIGSLSEFIGLATARAQTELLDQVLALNLDTHAMYNLVGATWIDGVVIHLSQSNESKNIKVLHVDTGNYSNSLINIKHCCILGENASLELSEEYLNLTETSTAHVNVSFDFNLASNSRCKHYILQDNATSNMHVATYFVKQGKSSEYLNFNLNFGGKLSRQDMIINQAADHATTYLYGVALPNGTQHMDSHLKIYHNSSHGKSVQDYRYVLADRGHGVFNGMVYVAQETVSNHAEQSNKNVLLSPHAEMDTKPELQIYSDDVICKHGATIGKLDEQSLFYLQSRGIDKLAAKKLLIIAFVEHIGELINNIFVSGWLNTKLNGLLEKI